MLPDKDFCYTWRLEGNQPSSQIPFPIELFWELQTNITWSAYICTGSYVLDSLDSSRRILCSDNLHMVCQEFLPNYVLNFYFLNRFLIKILLLVEPFLNRILNGIREYSINSSIYPVPKGASWIISLTHEGISPSETETAVLSGTL